MPHLDTFQRAAAAFLFTFAVLPLILAGIADRRDRRRAERAQRAAARHRHPSGRTRTVTVTRREWHVGPLVVWIERDTLHAAPAADTDHTERAA